MMIYRPLIKKALGVDSETLIKRNDELKIQLNEKNEENKDLNNALDGLRAVVETGEKEIERYVTIDRKELRGIP